MTTAPVKRRAYLNKDKIWEAVAPVIIDHQEKCHTLFADLVQSIDPSYALILFQAKEQKKKPRGIPQDIIDRYDAIWDMRPKMPDDVAKMLMLIVDRVATMGNFRNYTWLDDMKGEALVNVCLYWHRFKPYTGRTTTDEQGNEVKERADAFAYYTQVVYYAFIRKIGKEHKLRDIKDELMMHHGYSPSFNRQAKEENETKISETEGSDLPEGSDGETGRVRAKRGRPKGSGRGGKRG